MSAELPVLDPIDRHLVDLLMQDCKQSLGALGEKVGLSPPSVLERVRRLEEQGVVRGYHAQVDPKSVGLDIGCFIGVGIDHPRSLAAFEKHVSEMREVLECHHVTGRHTLMLKIRTADTGSLHQLISRLRELPGVARTETMVVLATQIERSRLPLPEVEHAPRRRRTKSARAESNGERGEA
jgi:Lrp/AsnC family leucine-responsive transcriptional regulator